MIRSLDNCRHCCITTSKIIKSDVSRQTEQEIYHTIIHIKVRMIFWYLKSDKIILLYFSNQSTQFKDGRDMKTIPERDKRISIPLFITSWAILLFSLQASKTECLNPLRASICSRACNSYPPIFGEDSVNKVFIINYWVVWGLCEEPVRNRKRKWSIKKRRFSHPECSRSLVLIRPIFNEPFSGKFILLSVVYK